jgi:hypothetical protein
MDELKTLIGEMKSDISWIKGTLEKLSENSLRKRYASKWTETVMKGLIGTVLFTVLGALLALIIVPSVTTVAFYYISKFV